MSWLTLIPLAPLLAAALTSPLPRHHRTLSAAVSIGSVFASTVLALAALAICIKNPEQKFIYNADWFKVADISIPISIIIDPLSACMASMVSFVALLIFIYSVEYMRSDQNFVRFFSFLSLFVGGMLTVVLANSLLLLFIGWEIVGLCSYLLIGFWYQKPSAAIAAQKAFLTTRIGDLGFLLAMVWIASVGGTLLFFNSGQGLLEENTIKLLKEPSWLNIPAGIPIGLLLFFAAMGKSGQFPLHIWLPDAMEGPTPVSALIHAATMVAAGVFLIARTFPIVSIAIAPYSSYSPTLIVITFVGVFTALFGGLLALAQNDIKRILAYSTISQLGYMFLALGVGSPTAAIFHLLSHSFFKALLFLAAGSVIHACKDEQDIRYMGGLNHRLKVTFVTYLTGAAALVGVPLFFSGFWSKESILHSAYLWPISKIPYLLALLGLLITAFYMTRQVLYVFFGQYRGSSTPHESSPIMLWPLVVLAVLSVAFGFVGTPWSPLLQDFLEAQVASEAHVSKGSLWTMLLSSLFVIAAICLSLKVYSPDLISSPFGPDPLEIKFSKLFRALAHRLYVDEFFQLTLVRWQQEFTKVLNLVDLFLWQGSLQAVAVLAKIWAWISKLTDEYVVNLGFDQACHAVRRVGFQAAFTHNGRLPDGLRGLALASLLFVLILKLI